MNLFSKMSNVIEQDITNKHLLIEINLSIEINLNLNQYYCYLLLLYKKKRLLSKILVLRRNLKII